MRTSLTPDFSKLVICTNNGYLMVVHDVDFDTMQDDLRGFNVSAASSWEGGGQDFARFFNHESYLSELCFS